MELPARMSQRFTLVEIVGRGTCSSVFRARDELLDRDVAVKIFPVTDDPRVAREVHLLASLDHPALVPVYDLGEVDGHAYVVMALFEGGSLADRLATGPLPLDQALLTAASIADALAHVHRAGVLHRDVIPRNVLFDLDGRAHLSDFGVALVADAPRITDTGIVVGAAPYLAPEQVRGEVVGPTADVYSLGLVTIEALTASPAYGGAPLEAAQARLEHPPAIPGGLPDEVGALIADMTADDPAARPDAETVCRRMRQLALAQEVAANDPRIGLPVGLVTDLTTIARGSGPARRAGRGSLVLGAATLSLLLASGVVIAATGPIDSVAATMTPEAGLAAPTVAAPAPLAPFIAGLDSDEDVQGPVSTRRSERSDSRERGSDSGSTVVARAPRSASASNDVGERGAGSVRPATPPRTSTSDAEPTATDVTGTTTTSESSVTSPEPTSSSTSPTSPTSSTSEPDRDDESERSTKDQESTGRDDRGESERDQGDRRESDRDESDRGGSERDGRSDDDAPRHTGMLEALGDAVSDRLTG